MIGTPVPPRPRREGLEPGGRRGAAGGEVEPPDGRRPATSSDDAAVDLWTEEDVDAAAVLRLPLPTMTAAILVEAGGDNRIVIVPGALERPHAGARGRVRGRDRERRRPARPARDPARDRASRSRCGSRRGRPHGPQPGSGTAVADRPRRRLRDAERDRGTGGQRLERNARRHARRARGRIWEASASPPSLRGRSTRREPAMPSLRPSRLRSRRVRPTLDAVRWGCAAGAHMVEHEGVIPGLPTRAQLEQRLAVVA